MIFFLESISLQWEFLDLMTLWLILLAETRTQTELIESHIIPDFSKKNPGKSYKNQPGQISALYQS